ncbi:unnamed protein product [Parnassius apollo]|uniref:(apollo) hypothetical protein n=1 Tax=Parnassius apollo TaxID=110799 RepID=A0A8S3W496_PARAO|nr:unnamed protein product [Parnassius apollo]
MRFENKQAQQFFAFPIPTAVLNRSVTVTERFPDDAASSPTCLRRFQMPVLELFKGSDPHSSLDDPAQCGAGRCARAATGEPCGPGATTA